MHRKTSDYFENFAADSAVRYNTALHGLFHYPEFTSDMMMKIISLHTRGPDISADTPCGGPYLRAESIFLV